MEPVTKGRIEIHRATWREGHFYAEIACGGIISSLTANVTTTAEEAIDLGLERLRHELLTELRSS